MFEWDQRTKYRVRQLVAEGKKASEIAREIGVSRNAVIGAVRRHDLGQLQHKPLWVKGEKSTAVDSIAVSAKPRDKRQHTSKPASVKPVAKPVPVVAVAVVEPRRITLMELDDRTCKWPVEGEREHTLFCGIAKPFGGTPYCPAHASRMYYPKVQR